MKYRKIALVLLIGCVVLGQEPQRFDAKVREDFFAGIGGDKDALARAMKTCEDAMAQNPKNAEAMAWHGSGLLTQAAYALASGDSSMSSDLWTRGLKEMQAAVDLEPNNVSIRITRGAALQSVSRDRATGKEQKLLLETGVADYERTYALQSSYFKYLGTHARGELLFGLAEGYSRIGNELKAGAYFEQIRKELPNTPYATRAKVWIETKSLPASETRCLGCHESK